MPILDVRSPSEFAHGHAVGALSLPLFSDQERHEVGLCYKTKGQAEAIRLGLAFVGPKMADLVKQADQLAQGSDIEVYCWRGGMRSQSMEWLFTTAGHRVKRWEGGYKGYRQRVQAIWNAPRPWMVLSGLTGSGKTEILRAMMAQSAPVFDLEGIAHHKGSAFGHVGEGDQPTQENFENNGAHLLEELPEKEVLWMEDESRSIGRIWMHSDFFALKKEAPLVVIERSRANRLDHLVALYGQASKEDLAAVFPKIAKRLGHQQAQTAIEAVYQGDLRSAADIALSYYDRTYQESIQKRAKQILTTVDVRDLSAAEAAAKIITETIEIRSTWLTHLPQH